MTVERYLQISMATVAALGTLLLGLGQQNTTLPMVAIFAAVTSVYFTDILGWFRLNRHLANLAAVGAVAFAILDFLDQESGTQLLSIANLLIYLQIVLLYQQKTLRVYWHLLVLSLLQVVVAAALNLGIEFGLLLVLYMFLALLTMALLFILCESSPFTPAAARDPSGQAAVAVGHARLESSDSSVFSAAHSARPRHGRFTPVMPTRRPAEAMLNRGMSAQVLRLGVTTLALTFLFFFMTPRFGSSSWQGAGAPARRLVGFSENVSLNDFGRILESNERVMRVQFAIDDEGTEKPYAVRGDLYMRGSVLADYQAMTGRWTAYRPQYGIYELPPALPQPRTVRQTILLEEPQVLFSTAPAWRLLSTPDELRGSRETGLLSRDELTLLTKRPSQIRYEVGTTAFQSGLQRQFVPAGYGHGGRRNRNIWDRYTVFQEGFFSGVQKTAEEVLEEANVAGANRLAKIRALEAYFHQPNLFKYTLVQTRRIRGAIDPIEYFVTEHREGHCEYFASALALMLRSQGIPARLVVGFRGGDYNRLGHFYQIRQLHAHAWVEAFLEPGDVTPDLLAPGEEAPRGGWFRVDPTPGGVADPMSFPGATLLERLGQCTDYVQMLWNEYILGLDPQRQREAIYEPLANRTKSFRDNLLIWWTAFRSELVRKLGIDSLAHFYERWFNWKAAPILLGFGLLSTAVYLVLRRPVQRVWRVLLKRCLPRLSISLGVRRPGLEFYYRFERLLRRHGLRRRPGQTPRELALTATEYVQVQPEGASVARLPNRIVDSYYRARFGGRPLDTTEIRSVEHELGQLERILKKLGKRR